MCVRFEQLDLCRILLVLKPRPMKRLVALIMCAVSLGAAAQISFDAPWNPDANGDAQIGVSDLQSFLAVYGQDFALGTFITPDSTHMLINRGIADYTRCLGLCRFANGAARVATRRTWDSFR